MLKKPLFYMWLLTFLVVVPASAADLTADMSGDQRDVFDRVTDQALCPCNCPLTLSACLKQKPKCGRAQVLARYVARQTHNGLTTMDILGHVADGFASSEATPPVVFQNRCAKGSSKGKAGAKIQVVEFADFRCPHCKEAEGFMQELMRVYGDRIELTFKHFPLQGLEPSVLAAEAAEAAAAQNKFWPYHDLLFKNQEQGLARDDLIRYATELKLDVKRFTKELDEHVYRAKVLNDREEGLRAGIDSTPTLYINGRLFKLDRTLEDFRDRAEYETDPDCQ
jgi:predicted DsbA family dithiol-disulfide isomerase